MNRFPIEKETFQKYSPDSKLDTMFDLMLVQHEGLCDSSEKLNELAKKLERKKKIDATISGFFGLVGGMIAVLTKHLFMEK